MRFYYGKLSIKRSLNFRFRPNSLTLYSSPTLKIILAILDILQTLDILYHLILKSAGQFLKRKYACLDLHFIKSIDVGKNGCLKNIESSNP